VIVRLMVLFLAGCAFTALLGIAAAAPALGEREYSDFRTCIASIPHPLLPAELLTRDVASKNRALALLGAEDRCARASGFDGSGRERPLEWLRAQRPGGSESNAAAEFFARCSRDRRSEQGTLAQIGAAVYCYKASGGLSATQFELASGFNPQYDFFSKRVKDAPVLSKRRFPRTMLHARDGTWWNHSCS
jgi:hypothetical protein